MPQRIDTSGETVRFTFEGRDVEARAGETIAAALIASGELRQEQPPENVYFRAGEQVEIIDGPLSSLSGVFESAKGDERVIVLLNLINQQQRVELSSRQLRRSES